MIETLVTLGIVIVYLVIGAFVAEPITKMIRGGYEQSTGNFQEAMFVSFFWGSLVVLAWPLLVPAGLITVAGKHNDKVQAKKPKPTVSPELMEAARQEIERHSLENEKSSRRKSS